MLNGLLGCLWDAGITGISRASAEKELVAAIAAQQPGELTPGLLCLDRYRLVFPVGVLGGRPKPSE